MDEADFARVITEGRALQQRFPELGLVAVGGTAAALHCHHRYSLDVDEVTPWLQPRYEEIVQALEAWEGWQTNRRNPPVLLSMRDPDLLASAQLWKFLLEDLHPDLDLSIDLHQTALSSAV